jgi:hypothetical protein
MITSFIVHHQDAGEVPHCDGPNLKSGTQLAHSQSND